MNELVELIFTNIEEITLFSQYLIIVRLIILMVIFETFGVMLGHIASAGMRR